MNIFTPKFLFCRTSDFEMEKKKVRTFLGRKLEVKARFIFTARESYSPPIGIGFPFPFCPV